MTLIYLEGNRLIPGIYFGWEDWSANFVEAEDGLLSGQVGRMTFSLQSPAHNYRHHRRWLDRHEQLELSLTKQKQPQR